MPGETGATDFTRDSASKPWLEDRPRKRSADWPEGSDIGSPPGRPDKPGYYDVPMLKPPVWTWEIETYFFLGGVSAGSLVLSRLADRLGGGKSAMNDLSRAGGIISALSALPCAPLLIADLGDRARFHHMLRIWKPRSPMNFGSWVLTGYMPLSLLMGLREWARTDPDGALGWAKEILRDLDPALRLAGDIAGIPLALLLAGYTGVLLSSTATPVWSKNPYLGALFSAGAISAASSAVHLAFETTHEAEGAENEEVSSALSHIGSAAHAAEAVTLAGYLQEAGDLAEPLTKGPLAAALWGGVVAAGIVLPELLELIPAPPKTKRWLRVVGSVAGLVGGFFLRRAVVRAGAISANDPEMARRASRAKRVTDVPQEEPAESAPE